MVWASSQHGGLGTTGATQSPWHISSLLSQTQGFLLMNVLNDGLHSLDLGVT